MKRLLILVPLVATIALLSSCKPATEGGAPPPKTTGDTLLIGLNTELTGSIPVVGRSCRNAAELAVKDLNESGGLEVGGRKFKVELMVEDNEDKAESATAAAQKLVASGVLAMIGPNASRNAIPASEVAESAKVPMISPWSTNPKLTVGARDGKPKQYVYRACFTDEFQAAADAKFVLNYLKSKRPAILYDVSSEANKGQAEVFKKTLEAGGTPSVAFETYTSGDKDFSSQLSRIVAAKADSLFLPNYYSEVPMQVKQARRLGYTGPVMGSDAWSNTEILKLSDGALEGQYFTMHYAPDRATPLCKDFMAKYKSAYQQDPDDVAALTYDAFGLLFEAIRTAGVVDRVALGDALRNTKSFEGVTGRMQFKGTGDPVKSAVVLQVKGGKFVYHDTVNP